MSKQVPTGNYVSALARWEIRTESPAACKYTQILDDDSADRIDGLSISTVLALFCRSISADSVEMHRNGSPPRLGWRVSDPAAITCLKTSSHPLPSNKAEVVIRKLGLYLASLHEKGWSCLDISPALTLVCRSSSEVVTVPTIRLLPTHRLKDSESTYIAPEILEGHLPPDRYAQADLYGFGQLAWTLLTGQVGRHPSFALPSDISRDLAGWDEFVDAVCREHPDRRPKDVGHALDLLPSKSAGRGSLPQPTQPPQKQEKASSPEPVPDRPPLIEKRPVANRRSLMLGAGGLGVLGLWAAVRSYAGSDGALRGFADTIIRYPNRSYAGAQWTRTHSAEALRGVMSTRGCRYVRFVNVTGYDDDNLWVTCNTNRGAAFFQLRQGHWEYRNLVGESPPSHYLHTWIQRPRLITSDKFIPCVNGAFYEVTPAATRKVPAEKLGYNWYRMDASGVAVIAEDYYIHTMNKSPSLVVQNGTGDWLQKSKRKEAFVFSAKFNAPLEEYEVASIGFPSTFARGTCIAVCLENSRAIIVEFRDGRWWAKCDVGLMNTYETHTIDPDKLCDAYFGTIDGRTPGFAILCGPAGAVIFLDLKGIEEDRSVVPRQSSTPANLIRAWGVHPEKYWVMDSMGEVWERENGQTRVVVRGLHDSPLMDSDVGFNTAWVSPSGNVFAATNNHLFELR